ncbi:MAG: hypothetical protein IIY94_02675 [Oscillospiraceae bacterium]|nr:hypothetical protein [Oscillospiraceae bacterium]
MKTKELVAALNLADEEFVKQAGIAGGHLSSQDEVGNTPRIRMEKVSQSFRQETAKQRHIKQGLALAACLALAAVSCGAWLLLDGKLGARNSNGGTAVGSSASQCMVASTEAAQTSGIDFNENITILFCGESARCGLGESPENAVGTLYKNTDFVRDFNSHQIYLERVENEEAQQLLADGASGAFGLQRGLGLELAALAEREPERVCIISTIFRGKKSINTPEQRKIQYFFVLRNEEGFWKVFDAGYPEDYEIPQPSEEAIEAMCRTLEQLKLQPSSNPQEMITDAADNAEAYYCISLGGDDRFFSEKIDVSDMVEDLFLQNGRHAEILEKLKQDPENFMFVDAEFMFVQEDGADDILIVETFFFARNEDGLWELLDATVPKLG